MGRPSVRVLVIPGLHGSGPAHWQTWLQSRLPGAVRVEQDDWHRADLDAWSARIGEVLDQMPDLPHVAVAHSFGCLALAHCLGQRLARRPRDGQPTGVQGALLVAPAEPERFGIAEHLPHQDLHVPSMVFASETDPWMTLASARRWAGAWGASVLNLGDVGHINTEAGFGPLPRALHLTRAFIQRIESSRRMSRVDVAELSFAV